MRRFSIINGVMSEEEAGTYVLAVDTFEMKKHLNKLIQANGRIANQLERNQKELDDAYRMIATLARKLVG